MESNFNTTAAWWPDKGEVRRDGYILVRSPHKGLYVRVQLGVDPLPPGTILHVTDEELDALRYRRVTIMGIIESHHQDEIRKAKLEQMKEMMKARAEIDAQVAAERNKPLPVKMTVHTCNSAGQGRVSITHIGSGPPLFPGQHLIEVKEIEIQ